MAIKLIVGLGNPGTEYETTRHNAGFWFVDELAARSGITLTKQTKYFGHLGKGTIAGEAVWLLKPSTFMNRSGQAVAAVINFYQLAPENVFVAHDELDLLPGQTKMKQGGSHAGHNGLKDIAAKIGSLNFWRLRLGIGRPRTLELTQEVADFVLHKPSKTDRKIIDDEIDRAIAVMDDCVSDRFGEALLKLHTRV